MIHDRYPHVSIGCQGDCRPPREILLMLREMIMPTTFLLCAHFLRGMAVTTPLTPNFKMYIWTNHSRAQAILARHHHRDDRCAYNGHETSISDEYQ